MIEITETTLRRLDNYQAVTQRELQEADRQQWRTMTLEVMQAAEKAKTRARHVAAAVANARYLHLCQIGQEQFRAIYGEPLLSQALRALLEELCIVQRMAAESVAQGRHC